MINGNKISAKGSTNLVPESRIYLNISPREGSIIGGDGSTRVESNGTFELEASVPDDFEGLLHLELGFEAGEQNDEVKSHYSEGITGNYARIYYDSYDEVVYSKAAFIKTISFDGESQEFAITEPEWNKPDDLGSPTVWIKPSLERMEDFIVVKIESNLIEETFIRATADIPNYITTGFSGSSYTNPDGSAVLYIEDPEKDSRIKNLTEYEIEIEVDPANSNNGKQVHEVYGENGGKLSGDLVYNTDDGKAVSQQLTITVE